MTQVQLTDQQLNDELRLLLGWTKIGEHPDGHFGCWKTPEGKMWGNLTCGKEPDYCGDPAASLEVQTAAIKVSTRYVDTLVEVMKPENMAYSRACVAELLTATPRERAEAAYITLQGAKGNGQA